MPLRDITAREPVRANRRALVNSVAHEMGTPSHTEAGHVETLLLLHRVHISGGV